METLSIGLLGCGTVGGGVVRILHDNAADIEARLGVRLDVKRIAVANVEKEREVQVPRERLTSDANSVIDDPEIDIVVELVGGTGEARDYVLRAIRRKKHVVTANKALLAIHGDEVFGAASENGVDVFFEGAVAGGIPIIRALRESMASERITRIVGIVNGTTNYILTQMSESGARFEDALREAQRLGYAEADPTADVDGHDAAQKLSILASLGFGTRVGAADVHAEGIRHVRPEDFKAAARFGHAIKLLAIAERKGSAIAARVHPAWVPAGSMLAHVRGVFNAVSVDSEALGTTLFYGRGAGQLPTGSAVVSDIIDVARNIRIGATGRVPHLATRDEALRPHTHVPIEETSSAFYLRFEVADFPGVLARIAGALGNHGVSLRVVHQDPDSAGAGAAVPIDAITHGAKERSVREAIAVIDAFDVVRAPTRAMRILLP